MDAVPHFAPQRRTRWRRLPRLSLHGRLALLAVVAVLPLLGLGAVDAWLRYRAEWNGFADRTLDLAHAMARTVEAEHQARATGLQVLALSGALQAGDVERFRGMAQRFIDAQPRGSTLGVADETGQLLLAVGDVPQGAPLPKRRNMVALEQVFRTAKTVVSDVFRNALTGRQTFTVDVPVFRDGRVAYDLGLDPTSAGLSDLVAQQRFEEGWVVSVFDTRGTIAARWPNGERFAGQLVSPALLSTLASAPEGILESTSLDGTRLIAAYSRSEKSGWGVAVGVPLAQATGPLQERLIAIFGLGALALGASLALAAAVSRGIAGPIASLARYAGAAASQGAGSPLARAARATGLREVDEVGRALAAAATGLREANATLEHRVEEEVGQRMQAEERLRQSQRMEAVGQLTAGVAHDFNNLLQAQMAGLELLLDAVRGQERATRYAEAAIASSEKGARLTHSLLSFSRKQVLRPEAVDVPVLLDRLQGLLSRTLDPRIALRVDVDAGLAPPLADPAQLEAALLNLCLNARDAMAGHAGQLLVEAVSGAALAGDALEGVDPAGCTVLAVTDEGSGMDAATLARVCEPFFTTKGVGQGSGLGLSMVQGFARQSGGELRIESWPGVGTRVEIWLPRAATATIAETFP